MPLVGAVLGGGVADGDEETEVVVVGEKNGGAGGGREGRRGRRDEGVRLTEVEACMDAGGFREGKLGAIARYICSAD